MGRSGRALALYKNLKAKKKRRQPSAENASCLAQPVPPIFQPEVAARAIVYAAQHHPRELWVGGPTAMAIVGNTVAPGFLDHYLGRTGYDAQTRRRTRGAAPRQSLRAPATRFWSAWQVRRPGARSKLGVMDTHSLSTNLMGRTCPNARDHHFVGSQKKASTSGTISGSYPSLA